MLNKLNKNFDSNIKKIKKLKIQLTFTVFLLLIILVIGIFIFLPVSWQKIAIALTGNYSKVSGTDQLTVSDWNNLPNDFLDKQSQSGDTMAGPLTLSADPTTNMQAATKQYVDNNSGGGGGDTFVNWGRGDCPSGTTELFSGWAFGAYWNKSGGATNAMCLQNDFADAGDAATSYSSELVPFKLASDVYIPGDLSAAQRKKVKCANCYNPNSICYTVWGTDQCNATGFNTSYTGWAMGGFTFLDRKMETDFYCINENFDNAAPNDVNFDNVAVLYGIEIESTNGLPANNYSIGSFVKCAVCCN